MCSSKTSFARKAASRAGTVGRPRWRSRAVRPQPRRSLGASWARADTFSVLPMCMAGLVAIWSKLPRCCRERRRPLSICRMAWGRTSRGRRRRRGARGRTQRLRRGWRTLLGPTPRCVCWLLTFLAVPQLLRLGEQLIWAETPTNPLLSLVPIGLISRVAKAHKIPFVVDNTFASPYWQNPLLLGADGAFFSFPRALRTAPVLSLI